MAARPAGWPTGPFCVVRWCIWRPIICSARSATRSTFVGCPIRGILRPLRGRRARRFASWSSRPSCGWTRDWPKRWRACRALPEGCRLNVFGPVMRDTDLSLFAGHPRAAYGGVLEPGEMPRVLSETRPAAVSELPQARDLSRHHRRSLPVRRAGHCRQVGRRSRDRPPRAGRAARRAPLGCRSASRHRAAAGRPRPVPAAVRGGRGERGERFRSAVWYDRVAQGLARPVRLAGARYGAGRPLIFRKHREDGRRPQCSRRPLAAEQTRDRAPQARHVGAPEQQRGAQRQSSRPLEHEPQHEAPAKKPPVKAHAAPCNPQSG